MPGLEKQHERECGEARGSKLVRGRTGCNFFQERLEYECTSPSRKVTLTTSFANSLCRNGGWSQTGRVQLLRSDDTPVSASVTTPGPRLRQP